MPQSVTVMVVEDDSLVQAVLEDALIDGGFTTAVTRTGEEAVTLIKGNRNHYRALVTDIHLAGKMDGWEVARRARAIDTAFPIIYITGRAVEEWASCGVPNSVLLPKPFAPAQLVTAVSQLLNGT